MVNIHLFNFNNQLNTPRAQICVSETLKHQTNYHLNIWTENSPEIKEIIQNSKYCQAVLKESRVSWPSIYDYVKLHIMKKYGGWFLELDHIVITDLSTVTVENGKSYFPISPFASSKICAATWIPVYASKGVFVDDLIKNADEKFSSPLEPSEVKFCEFPPENITPDIVEGLLPVEFYHFCTRKFESLLYGNQIIIYEKNEKIQVYYHNFGDTKKSVYEALYNFETFNKIGKLFNYFNIQVPKFIDSGGSLFLSQSVYDKVSKEYELDSRVNVIPNSECNGDLGRFFNQYKYS